MDLRFLSSLFFLKNLGKWEKKERDEYSRKPRAYLIIPEWVLLSMIFSLFILFICLISAGFMKSVLVSLGTVVLFTAFRRFVYWRYRQQDRVSAEIAFNNESDGYFGSSGGDGGDGGGD